MADPYSLFDAGAGGVMGELGGMRGGGGNYPSPHHHQGLMTTGGGMLGMSDPSHMGGMMQGQGMSPQQQQTNPQAMNAYAPHQTMQMHHQGVAPSPKLQHYGQYGGDYGTPAASRLHHLGGDSSMRGQPGGMPPHQQMSSASSMMTSMIQQQQQQQQPQQQQQQSQYQPPIHRPPVNPSQHTMYSMHNSNMNPTQSQALHPQHQQQQHQTHSTMQINQGMMWQGQNPYPGHTQQQQQQQHRPQQQTQPFIQRMEYGTSGMDAGVQAQRLAHYSDAGLDQQGGSVGHIPHPSSLQASKMGPVGIQQRPQGSPSYQSVAAYHTAPDQRVPPHAYSYGDIGTMVHSSQAKAPQYGTPYGSNGTVQSQPYQVQQQQQTQSHVPTGHPHVNVASEPTMGARSIYSQAPQQSVPNGSPQYRPAYQQVSLSPRRPTPTPPVVGSPMPHTPDRHVLANVSTSQAQGSYSTPSPSLSPSLGQSSLQQLEQMVMPATPQSHSSPFHTTAGIHHSALSSTSHPPGLGQSLPQYGIVTSAIEQRQQQQQQQQQPHMSHHVPMPSVVSTSVASSSTSPILNAGSPLVGNNSPGGISSANCVSSAAPTSNVPQQGSPLVGRPPHAMNSGPHSPYDMQQLQQQLHQLYNMQQTSQTQQKIMEIQDQMRILQQHSQIQHQVPHHGPRSGEMQTPPVPHDVSNLTLSQQQQPLPAPPRQVSQMQSMSVHSPQSPSAVTLLTLSSPNLGHIYNMGHQQSPVPLVPQQMVATHPLQQVPTTIQQVQHVVPDVPQPYALQHEPNTLSPISPASHPLSMLSSEATDDPHIGIHIPDQQIPPLENDLAMGLTFSESNPCDSLLGGLDTDMMMPFAPMPPERQPAIPEMEAVDPLPKKPKKPRAPRVKKPKKNEKVNNFNLDVDPTNPFLMENASSPLQPVPAPIDEIPQNVVVVDNVALDPKPKKKRPKKKKALKENEGDLVSPELQTEGEVLPFDDSSSPIKPDKPKKPRTPKKPREPKLPKEPKEPKEKKPKKPREPRPPKEPKPPKSPKPAKESKTSKEPKEPKEQKKPKEVKEKKVKTPKEKDEVKPKTPRSLKRRPTKLNFSFSKKRKRAGDSDISDVEKTPPTSPVEEDESLKRRSARNTKRKKYTDDIDISISDDDDDGLPIELEKLTPQPNEAGLIKPVQFFVNPNEEDAMLVERILAMRMTKPEPTEEGGESEMVEEFYVKYKNFSYLHCDWKTQEELEKGDKRVIMKIKRYKQKKQQASNIFEFLEEEAFNPDYVEVDRVLDVSETTDAETKETTKHFLVKWRGLAYDDSTWELEEDIEKEKIDQFIKFREPPTKEQLKIKKKPKPSEWQKLEISRDYKHDNKLREYQLEGLNWLTFSWYNGQNCILADEMGLGKTIQSITFLCEVVQYGIRGPFLVIAPLSTITNWQREFESWSDLNVIVYHGSAASRNMIQEYEMYFKDEEGKRIPNIYKVNAMITTFEIIITDCLDLREIPWRCVIIDEAHRLKNMKCKLLEGLRLLNMEHRVLLSGTPLQNNVEELFSLLNFLEPTQFASSEEFLKEFGDLKSESQVQKLQQLLKPMMLRRLKEDVEKSLAPKEETIIEVELTNIQKKYYRGILERNFSFLAKGTAAANVPNLMNTMMELRKCCIHPYLLNGAEEQIHMEYKSYNVIDAADEPYLQAMIHSSGKLVLIDKLLPKLKDSGHRVLIFSQMVRCLDILEDYLVHRRYPYERIDGRVRGNMRQAAIDRFSKPDSDRFVFLLCTRAGGLGINLTAADTVIIFDSDWNPQNDLQAQARCHRIGQQKSVKCYRLICRNTYEREMFDKASLKLGLDKAVLQSMNCVGKDGIPPQQLTKKEIEDLLRKGAYGAIMDDDNAADQFCEEDIDQILQRRTQVIQLESGVKGSTFAKASFVASDNRSDIDIDDPEFWQKWAKKADVDLAAMDGKNELIVTQPRRRIQTRRFGNEDQMLELTDLESSDDDDSILGLKRFGKKSRGSRKRRREEKLEEISDERPMASWGRAECFKVEKGLLTFGWGRWMELIATMKFKMRVENRHLEEISRIILLYCLRFYRGDDKIKSAVWDLIVPKMDVRGGEILGLDLGGDLIVDGNHLGLSGFSPVPRARKNKKSKKDQKLSPSGLAEVIDWTLLPKYDPEVWLVDENYKKHLQRHSNRIVLRVRLLYYLKQEIIGNQAARIAEGLHVSNLDMQPPWPDGEPPVPWWDEDADKSILVGVYKHGYEKYNVMRLDPTLSFLAKCGPPDGAAVLAEINDNEGNEFEMEEKVQKLDEAEDEDALSPPGSPKLERFKRPDDKPCDDGSDRDPSAFPSVSDLNTRLRRLITGYQRNSRKREQRMVQNAKKMERQEKFQAAIRERELRKRELQQRKWSRREEADFYRVVSSFGVEYLAKERRYDWNRFRNMARLEKKYDDTVTEYFKAFYAMCKKVCGKKLADDEEHFPIIVEPITEERARRCLERVDLLSKIREEILPHPELDERLKLCKTSMDLPDWWVNGKHDKELLIGAAKYGLGRMDYHLMHDPDMSFHDIIKFGPQTKEPSNVNQSSSQSSPVAVEKTEDDAADGTKDLVEKEEVKNENGGEIKKEKLGEIKKEKEGEVKNEKDGEVKNEKDEEVKNEKDEEVKNEKDEEVKDEKDEEVKDGKDEEVKSEEDESAAVGSVGDEIVPIEQTAADKEKVKSALKIDLEMQPKEEEPNKEENLLATLADVPSCLEDCMPKAEPIEEIPTQNNDAEELTVDPTLKLEDGECKLEPVLRDDKTGKEDSEEEIPISAKNDVIAVDGKDEISTESICSTLVKIEDDEIKADVLKQKCGEEMESGPVSSQKVMKEEAEVLAESKVETTKEENVAETIVKEEIKKMETIKCETALVEKDDKQHEVKAFNKEEETDTHKYRVKDEFVENKTMAVKGEYVKDEDFSALPSSTSEVLYHHPIYGYDLMDSSDQLATHVLVNSYHNPIRWPKDRVLQMRLEAVVQCVDKNEWPVVRFTQLFPQGPSQSGTPASVDMDSTPQVTPENTPKRESTPWNTPTHPSEKDNSDSNNTPEAVSSSLLLPPRRRRRRRRIEIEAERAKLQALLSHNLYNTSMKMKFHLQRDSPTPESLTSNVAAEKKTPSAVPPPAHQHSVPRVSTPVVGTWDFSTSRKVEKHEDDCAAPIDLSSSLKSTGQYESLESFLCSSSNMNKGTSDGLVMDLQLRRQEKKLRLEEQLAKIKNQKTPGESSGTCGMKDDSRLKKRRKLDEIVGSLAASAAPVLTYSSPEKAPPKILNMVTSEQPIKKLAAPTSQQQLENDLRNSHLLHLASKRLEVEKWLADHSLQTIARRAETAQLNQARMDHLDHLDGRRSRRPRIDPNKLSVEHLTGNENVSVVNRLTGKKITGSKAPPIKHLAEWLKQNRMFDVDSKWAQLIKDKGNLPEDLKKRINFPSGRRGRRPGSSSGVNVSGGLPPRTLPMPNPSSLSSSYSSMPNLGALSSLANANMLAAGFPGLKLPTGLGDTHRGAGGSSAPMFLPFGGLAGLGLTNPLFANLASLGFAGFPFASSLSGIVPDMKSGKDGSGNKSGAVTSSGNAHGSSSTTTTTAQSLPLLFPAPGLLYNPLGLGNFSIPTSVPTSFTSLAQAGLVNGLNTTRAGTFGTVTTPSMMAGGMGSVLPGPNGMVYPDDSDEDSLRSLMGNNYDDDDSTATEDEMRSKKEPTVRKKEMIDVKFAGGTEQKSMTRMPVGFSSSRNAPHQSSRSSNRPGTSKPTKHRVVDRARRSEHASAAEKQAREASRIAIERSLTERSEAKAFEKALADRAEAKAFEKVLADRVEAKALERSMRAERRSKKMHLTEGDEKCNDRERLGLLPDSSLMRSLEKLIGRGSPSAASLGILDLQGGSSFGPKSMAKEAESSKYVTSLLHSVHPKIDLTSRMAKCSKLLGVSEEKPLRTKGPAAGIAAEKGAGSGVDGDVIGKDKTAASVKSPSASKPTNQSGERIRLLSEKLKEKLQRSNSECGDAEKSECVAPNDVATAANKEKGEEDKIEKDVPTKSTDCEAVESEGEKS